MDNVRRTRDEYVRLRDSLVSQCRDVGPTQISSLKRRYEDKINSARRCDYVTTVADLVNVLEKRDCLSEDDVTVLTEIAKHLQLGHEGGESSQRRPNRTDETDLKERVRRAIVASVGTSWLSLARELGVAEGKIDQLKRTHRTDCERCASEVLRLYDAKCSPIFWKSGLLEALSRARLNGLRIRVLELMDLYS